MSSLLSLGSTVITTETPPNEIIPPNETVKAADSDSSASILRLVPSGPMKSLLFLAILYVGYKYLKRRF